MRLIRALVAAAMVLLVLASVPYPALADGGVTYIVRPGDTLALIAAANGSTTQALIDANGLPNPDLLRAGQRLIIPRGTAAPPTAVRAAPQSASSPAGPVRPSTYVVKPGQTLSQIARELGGSLAAIVDANGLANPDRIFTGMTLLIPGTQDVAALAGTVTDTRFIASISSQRCWLYQAGKLTGNWRCSTGRKESPTVPGTYKIQSKINPAYASRWVFWMPYWMGLYYAGSTENGIHGLPYDPKTGRRTWAGAVGTPITYGCIMLDDINAKALFGVAYIGMPVVILP
jgi:LysM repeat protein